MIINGAHNLRRSLRQLRVAANLFEAPIIYFAPTTANRFSMHTLGMPMDLFWSAVEEPGHDDLV